MTDHSPNTGAGAPTQAEKLGTYLGVYTPSVLTVLWLVMYLRIVWVVGNVGLEYTILIVLLASSVTTVTAFRAPASIFSLGMKDPAPGIEAEYARRLDDRPRASARPSSSATPATSPENQSEDRIRCP